MLKKKAHTFREWYGVKVRVVLDGGLKHYQNNIGDSTRVDELCVV